MPGHNQEEVIGRDLEGVVKGALKNGQFTFISVDGQPDVYLNIKALRDPSDKDRLKHGTVVVFEMVKVRDKLQARKVTIKSDPVLTPPEEAVVTAWPWNYGWMQLVEGGDIWAHESTLDGTKYLRPGDVVNVQMDSNNEVGRIVPTGEWKSTHLSDYERDLDMGNPQAWLSELIKLSGNEERWDVQGKPESGILRNYFKYTYLRQKELSDHLLTAGDLMCWNTGLMDHNGDDILCELKRKGADAVGPTWIWRRFLTVADRSATNWRDAPRAKYWDNPADLIYDTDRGAPTVQSEHIGEKVDERFPEHMKKWSRQDLVRAVQEAAQAAVKQVIQNYKTAIPQFYRAASGKGEGSIQLLLPLRFPGQQRPTLALAVRRDGDHYYAATVLKIDWAYTYARLLTKPDTEWLNPFED